MASNLPHSKDLEIFRLKQYQERFRKERKKNQALKKQLKDIEELLEQKERHFGLDWFTFSREDIQHIRNIFNRHEEGEI